MDQHHYVSTDFPEDLKQLIKAKQAEVTKLKSHQLALKAEQEHLRSSCIPNRKISLDLEKEQLTVDLFDQMTEFKTVSLTLKDFEKKLWEVLHEFTSLMNTKMHIEEKHGIKLVTKTICQFYIQLYWNFIDYIL